MGKRERSGMLVQTSMVAIPAATVTCSICQQVMHNPANLPCMCRRSFCRRCIVAWRKKSVICPLCNTSVPLDGALESGPAEWGEALDSLRRPCPNNCKCRFKKKIFYYDCFEDADTHAHTECAFRKVTCPNEACNEALQQHQLKKHLRLCLFKQCKNFRPPRYGCAATGTVDFIERHEKVCVFNEVEVLKQIEELAARNER